MAHYAAVAAAPATAADDAVRGEEVQEVRHVARNGRDTAAVFDSQVVVFFFLPYSHHTFVK